MTAYVTYWNNGMTGTLMPINTVTDRAGAAIEVGEEPLTVAHPPGGTPACVVIQGGSAPGVVPIKLASHKVGRTINAGPFPGAVAITPNGKAL
jgi:DNA-binding beta-propeller fold protein YncE